MLIKKRMPLDRYYFLRKVGEFGKYVIPIQIREELKIKENDLIKLSIVEKSFTDRVDGIGRIVIPKEIRNELDIKVADTLKIYIQNGNIILENKYIA